MAQETTEGKVDWTAAADFHNGKKAEDAPAPTEDGGSAPDMEHVSIRGRKVAMTKEAADAYREFVRETRERDGRLGGEIAQLRERSARLEGMIETVRTATPAADEVLKPPPPELAVEDFRSYHAQMMAYNAAMMLKQQAELEEKYETDKQHEKQTQTSAERQKAWADKFYSANPELNKPKIRDVVLGAYRDNQRELQEFGDDTDGAHARLAELSYERLVEIAKEAKAQTSDKTSNRTPHLEGAGDPAGRGKSTGKDEHVPVSASSWSTRKRAALRGDAKK